MTRDAGFSVVELLLASAVLLVVSGAALSVLHDGLAGTPILEEATDLHQRARVIADAVAADVRAAAAGTPLGALSRQFAAVEPRHAADPSGSVSNASVTVRYVPAGGAHSRLTQPLEPGVPVAIVEGIVGCPAGTTACGFVAGVTAVVFDSSQNASFVSVDAIGPGVLTISDIGGTRAASYPAGSEIAEAVQVSYAFDAATRQLRRTEGGGTFVVTDNVAALGVEYFGDGMVALPLAAFGDGPFRGSGPIAFDLDLLGIRAVRVAVRLETGVDSMRGTDPRVFLRPGTARGVHTIPDLFARVDVSLRNVGRWP